MSLPEVIQCKLWEHVEEIVDQPKPSEPGVAALADRNGRLPLHHAADFSCPVALVEKLRYAFPAAVRCADDNDILPASIAAMRHGPVHAYLEPKEDPNVLRTPRGSVLQVEGPDESVAQDGGPY